MPTPKLKITPRRGKAGPEPTCTCMKCPKCKNRLRQRKFYEENSIRLKMGFNLTKIEEG